MKNKLMILSAIAAVLVLTGCGQTYKALGDTWNKKLKVEYYSGGVLIGTWFTTNTIEQVSNNRFVVLDEKTSNVVQLVGDIVVTVAN